MAVLDENKLVGKYHRLDGYAISPQKAYDGDGGWDLFSCCSLEIGPHETLKVSTKIILCIPDGYVGVIKDRSSMAGKGIFSIGGVIDCGYRGECFVQLYNSTEFYFKVKKGDKIAQILILPVPAVSWEEVAKVDITERGEKGFGSSNKV